MTSKFNDVMCFIVLLLSFRRAVIILGETMRKKGKRNFERLIVALLALVICMSNISFDAMANEAKTSAKEETLKSEKSAVEPEKQEAPKSEKSASESKKPEVIKGSLGTRDASIYDENGKLKDGTYSVTANTDSSMFGVTSCKLLVQNGQMNAIMTLRGMGFNKVYMGMADEAKAAKESDIIGSIPDYSEETKGKRTFWNIPVDGFDKDITISARSSKKRKWYDHTIRFEKDSLKLISNKIESPTLEQNAQKYLYQNFIDEKIFTANADVISVSGDSYTVPFFEKDEATEISSIKFKQSDTPDFKLGWHVSDWSVFSNRKKDLHAASTKSLKIKDRSAGDVDFDVTLKIYNGKDFSITRSTIMDDSAPALAEKTFHIKLKGAPAPVDVAFDVKDIKTGKSVPNPTIKIEAPDGTEVKSGGNGKYNLKVGVKYRLEISAPGYVDKDGNEKLSETLRVTTAGTIEKQLLAEKDSKHKAKFRIVDKDNKAIKNAKFEIIHKATNKKLDAEADGSYILKDDQEYEYTASADGYISDKNTIKITEDKDIDVVLRENIKIYKANFWFYSLTTYEKYSGEYELSVYSKDGERKEYVQPDSEGKYPLKRDVKYYYEAKVPNHYLTEYNEIPVSFNGEDENVEVRLVIDQTGDYKLSQQIDKAKDYLKTVVVGTNPGEYPQGAKEKLEKAIADAETLLAKQDASQKDKEDGGKKLAEAVDACKNVQNYAEIDVKVVLHINTKNKFNSPAQVMTLKVRGDECLKYGYHKSAIDAKRNVTVLDIACAVHSKLYGEDFKKNPENYFAYDFVISKMFAEFKDMYFFAAVDSKSIEKIERTVVGSGSTVTLSSYPSKEKNTQFLHFKEKNLSAYEGEEVSLHLLGGEALISFNGYDNPQQGYRICFENVNTNKSFETSTATDKNGEIKVKFPSAGTYRVKSVKNEKQNSLLMPQIEIKVKEDKPTLTISASKDGINVDNDVVLDRDHDDSITYILDKSKGLALSVIDGNFANFTDSEGKVMIDNVVLRRGIDYEAREGSIIISIKKEYLNNLTAGKHIVRIYEKNGYAQGTINIARAQNKKDDEIGASDGQKNDKLNKPGNTSGNINGRKVFVNTGDRGGYKLWIGIGIAAIIVFLGLVLVRRDKK